jgi:hypothetical protein
MMIAGYTKLIAELKIPNYNVCQLWSNDFRRYRVQFGIQSTSKPILAVLTDLKKGFTFFVFDKKDIASDDKQDNYVLRVMDNTDAIDWLAAMKFIIAWLHNIRFPIDHLDEKR